MKYSSGFPQHFRAAVEAEEVRASRDFEQARQKVLGSIYGPGQDLAAEVRRYILRIYAVFVREACKLGGVWGVDRIRSCAREFLRMLTSKAWSEKSYDTGGTTYPGQIRRLPDMTSHLNGAILPSVMSKFEKSVECLQLGDRPRGSSRRPGGFGSELLLQRSSWSPAASRRTESARCAYPSEDVLELSRTSSPRLRSQSEGWHSLANRFEPVRDVG
jgi:hypothetical protein